MVDGSKATSFLAVMLAIAAFLLCGCASTASNGNDQIVKAVIELAEEYRSLGRLEDSIGVYDKALERTYDYRLLYNKALTIANLGDFEQAAALCQEGHGSFPYILAFKKAQAKYYIELERWQDAASSYIEVLELDPYDTSTRKALISLYVTNNEPSKAAEQATILWNQGYRTAETVGLMKVSLDHSLESSKED